MAQFTIYRSTDTSAPTLSGTAGDLVNVLDKCLVAGYGTKAAAGWTKDFIGVNKATFRPASGTRLYLRVQDDAPGLGGSKEARVVGYETMSAVDTGVNPFPTVAQAANGQFVRKSTTADAVARSWIVAADGRTFYMFIDTGDTPGQYYAWMFGDIYSLIPGDLFNCQLVARSVENAATATNDQLDLVNAAAVVLGGTCNHYQARAYTQQGTAINMGQLGDASVDAAGATRLNIAGHSFPNVDATIIISRLWTTNPTTAPIDHKHGWKRGLWQVCHIHTAIPIGLVFEGSGDLVGRTFQVICKGVNNAIYCIETSNTLDTN